MQKAEFGVYIRRPTPWDPSYITWILVYTIEPQNPGQPPERKLIRRKRIQLNSEQTNHWHYFDVKAQVDRWLTKPNVSYAIQVQCSDARGEPLAIIQPRNRDEELLVSCFLYQHSIDSHTNIATYYYHAHIYTLRTLNGRRAGILAREYWFISNVHSKPP